MSAPVPTTPFEDYPDAPQNVEDDQSISDPDHPDWHPDLETPLSEEPDEYADDYKRAQRVLIGYLLAYPSMADEVLPMIPKERKPAFDHAVLRRVFEVIHCLHDRGAQVSEHTIIAEFKTHGWDTKILPSLFV